MRTYTADHDHDHDFRVAQTMIQQIRQFDQLDLPDDAVVIADRALPDAMVEALPDPLLVEAGESLKTLASVESLAEQVLERRSSRPITVVAVGGGSVGDAVGFLASTLWRGVELWHVPTTFLAMVDSAHGGKTAVNLGGAKNQLGTFYPADRVVIVQEALATLPLKQRRDGLVEMVKGLWIGALDAFGLLEMDGGTGELAAAPFEATSHRLMRLLERAISVKEYIVDRDMRETEGIRTFLNLGHTAAHALELHTGVSHGQAVGWGLLAASFASQEHADLTARSAMRLRRHIYPLLTPSAAVRSFDEEEAFRGAVERDKKRVEGTLRSVLLDGPGEPKVVESLDGADWYAAFRRAVDWYEESAVAVGRVHVRPARLPIEASKSEMNRALVIKHLRPGATAVEGTSGAEDVAYLKRALDEMSVPDGDVAVYCGSGGTTFRFLLAVAATREEQTTLLVDEQLLDRPHGPLIDALTHAGAEIDPAQMGGRLGVGVEGWHRFPKTLSVDASDSSQYASALALLAATGEEFELEIEGDAIASRPYFEMTLALLRKAGVEIAETDAGYAFSPGDALTKRCNLRPEVDASSAAVWMAGQLVGIDAGIAATIEANRQPDTRIADIVERLRTVRDDETASVEVDLADSPDLAPVLAAVATRIAPAVDLVGAAHLRHKESDRIADLAAAFAGVGIEVDERDDGLHIPAGIQRAAHGGTWQPAGDHRLVMAGLLLTDEEIGLQIEEPMAVAKSYPDFFHHARQVGWAIEP